MGTWVLHRYAVSSLNTNKPQARAEIVTEFIDRDTLHEPAYVFMVMSPDISVMTHMTQRMVRGRGLIGLCKWSLINYPCQAGEVGRGQQKTLRISDVNMICFYSQPTFR